MSDNVLSLVDLTHSFGERAILDGVTLGIDRGSKVGLIGSNGAGKSTLLKVIGGQLLPDEGDVVLRGAKNSTLWNRSRTFHWTAHLGRFCRGHSSRPSMRWKRTKWHPPICLQTPMLFSRKWSV